MVGVSKPFWERFDKQWIPEPNSGCWIWIGALDRAGYGCIGKKINGKWVMAKAHRVSFERAKGSIPEGLVPDHLCRITCCVNPDHMEAVTQKENVLRGKSAPAKNARKTHCKHDHPLSGPNLAVRYDPAGRAHRHCRACTDGNNLKWRSTHVKIGKKWFPK